METMPMPRVRDARAYREKPCWGQVIWRWKLQVGLQCLNHSHTIGLFDKRSSGLINGMRTGQA